jgi:xylitol oxidase
MMSEQRNWADNIRFGTTRLHHPETVAQVQEVVRGSRNVRVLGSRHSFSAIADSSGDLIALDRLAPVLEIDAARHTATVAAGITYDRLCRQLHEAGYALHNTASLPHITLAGACATATHGSGDRNGILATCVAALEFVAADGTVVSLSREEHPERFTGAVVSLGALGVVTRLTLNLLPTFRMRQEVYERLPLSSLEAHFTDWRSDWVNQIWIKRVVTDETPAALAPDFYGAAPATADLHPLPSADGGVCTAQMGVAGPWHERLPHFRMAALGERGEELQSEYFVPRAHAVAALRALNAMREEIASLLQMGEIRSIAADDLWMSPFYRRDCVAFHFTWRKDWERVRHLLPRMEAALAPYEPAPHWGKLFTMPAGAVQARYPKIAEFRALVRTYDPAGKFRNAFLDEYVFSTQ